MKKIITASLLLLCIAACSEKKDAGKFILKGELKNAVDQKIYLEQVYFSQKDPEVLDTGEIKNGKFSVNASAAEEGLYRLRLEKQEAGYLFINDRPEINFTANINVPDLQNPDFNTPANRLFKSFLSSVDSKQKNMDQLSVETDSLAKNKAGDSLLKEKIIALNSAATDFKHFIIKALDTVSDPVVAMFALGYTRGIEPAELKMVVPALAKRFPNNTEIAGILTQFNEMMTKKAEPLQPTPPPTGKPGPGSLAPEIVMNDTSGKPFSLSSLRGKYVLVDFWASWCAPCRGENPNVVANYNKYKNKNFTILGVSLDENRSDWIKAINKDKLAWKQISDLKGWSNAAVSKYGFDGIPYNVLIDPQGNIISTELREGALGAKLAEVLK